METWLRAQGRQLNSKRRAFRPDLERLEDRTTPTTLTNIFAAPTQITGENAPGTFTLRLVFDGPMNQNIAPVVTFPTAGEDPGSSLTFNALASGFLSSTEYLASYSTADQNTVISAIDVRVSGAVDFSNNSVNAL